MPAKASIHLFYRRQQAPQRTIKHKGKVAILVIVSIIMGNNETLENEKVIMYGSPMCSMVPSVRGVLQRAQAPFDYVNILEDTASSLRVKEINDGNASVPTLVFPDGSTLTEPSTAVLRQKLETLGYTIPKPSLWQTVKENSFNTLLGMGILLFGLYDQNWLFIGLGLILLLSTFLASRR